MSKPLNQIVYDIKEELSGFHITDDSVYENEYLISKINNVREVLIKENFRDGGLDGQFFQTMCCNEIKCHTQGCMINGKMMKSGSLYYYIDMPPLVTNVGWKNIMYLGLDDMMTGFARYNYDAYMSLKGALWTGRMPAYTYLDNKVFLQNLPTHGLKYVCGIFLLSNPIDACDFDSDNSIYPVPDVYKLELLVKKDILGTYMIQGDEMQNSRDMTKMMASQEQQQQNVEDNENE